MTADLIFTVDYWDLFPGQRESCTACDQFQHQLARRMVAKDLLSQSKCDVNIYNIRLDGGKKPSVTIKILKGILKLMRITSVFFYSRDNWLRSMSEYSHQIINFVLVT